MEASIDASNVRACFGEDAPKSDDRSPVFAVPGNTLPMGLAVAEFDPGGLGGSVAAQRYNRRLRRPRGQRNGESLTGAALEGSRCEGAQRRRDGNGH
jgi:hypothetical protein